MTLLRLPLLLLVLLYQSIALALGQIWANKMRSVLTTIGIVIGVASVLVVIAGVTGLKEKVLTEVETFGTNKVFVFPRRPDKGPMRNARWQTLKFTPEMFDDLLAHCPSLKYFTRVADDRQTVSAGERSEESLQVTGIEPSWHEIERRYVSLGRPFTLVDNTEGRPVCLINEALRDKLRLERDCTGAAVMVGDRRFTIVGVLEKKADSALFGGGTDSEIFVPFRALFRPGWGMYVIGASKSPEAAAEAVAEVGFYMRRARHLKPGEPDTFGVEYVERLVQQFNAIAAVITAVTGGLVGISLIVGGVGIMNIMLVSVSERTREIGLRKAVGARPAAILTQFLVEAVVLCVIGGGIGVGIGEGLTTLIRTTPATHLDKAAVPMWAIVLSFSFAAGVGLVFGMFPALKASRLDPIEALRHE